MIPSILLPPKIPLSHGFNEKSARSWCSRKSICMFTENRFKFSQTNERAVFNIHCLLVALYIYHEMCTEVFPQQCFQHFILDLFSVTSVSPTMSPACSTLCRKKDSFKIQPGLLDCLSTQGFIISFSFQTLIPTSNITLKWSVKPQTGVWMDVEKRELDKKLSVLQYVISLTV